MGFPSEGSESMYRNPMSEVQRLLELKHKDHYKVSLSTLALLFLPPHTLWRYVFLINASSIPPPFFFKKKFYRCLSNNIFTFLPYGTEC